MEHLFGTDGIRARFGTEPLTHHTLTTIGKALGKWLTTHTTNPTIAIGTDTRHSKQDCNRFLLEGLVQYPVQIQLYDVIPTPLFAHYIAEKQFPVGLMITASHNPAEDNGIKFFTPEGKFTTQQQEKLLYYMDVVQTEQEKAGKPIALITHAEQKNIASWYLKKIHPFFENNFLQHSTVVLDCANGAWFWYAPHFFKAFGAHVIELHCNPNGHNINANCGSTDARSLQAAVLEHNADFGFAFDGDGDRVVAVNSDGEVKNGDDLLALLSTHPRYKDATTFVGTIMSNQGLSEYFLQKTQQLIRTPVGDAHVLTALEQHGCLLGAEPSGHLIVHDFSNTADGLFNALLIAETALKTRNMKLNSFEKFPQMVFNVEAPVKKDLNKEPIHSLIRKYEELFKIGRLVIRYSGTEPVLRIMVEAPTKDLVQQLGQELADKLASFLVC